MARFDPTVGPVVRLYRREARSGSPIRGARGGAAAGRLARRMSSPMASSPPTRGGGDALDLGGIGKGIAVSVGGMLLSTLGFERHLIDFGSTIAAGEAPRGKAAWTIDVPFAGPLPLRRAAIAVSGDAEQFIEIDGVHRSHIVPIRGTGSGLANRARRS
ncbi:MAG: FAD:protein FMN transferase [Phycisphaerales bacterium]